MEMKKFNYMLEIDILRNSSQKNWVPWGMLFKGLGVQKDTQTPCWLIQGSSRRRRRRGYVITNSDASDDNNEE